jgi:hypothetical protein
VNRSIKSIAPAGRQPSGRRAARGRRGQSIVELALIAPVVLAILLVAVDFGRVFLAWITINNMARIGANYAALNPDGFQNGDSGVASRYQQLMAQDASSIDCAVPNPIPGPHFDGYSLGDAVSVDISCNFTPLTPFVADVFGGGVNVTGVATFNVRSGSVNDIPVNPPGITPPPQPTDTPSPGPTVTPDPSASLPPVEVSFYGEPTAGQPDASGGGPPGSPNEDQIVGTQGLSVTFTNTTVGTRVVCLWDFGDGSTQANCADTVARIYPTLGTYSVTLTVNGVSVTRSSYVLVGCKVPDFHGVHVNSAPAVWSAAGFTGSVTALSGHGNYSITYQSIVSGQVNPPGGCAAGITVGP